MAFGLQFNSDGLVCVDGAEVEVNSFSADERAVVAEYTKSLTASYSKGHVVCIVSSQDSEQVVHESFGVVSLVESLGEIDVPTCIMAKR